MSLYKRYHHDFTLILIKVNNTWCSHSTIKLNECVVCAHFSNTLETKTVNHPHSDKKYKVILRPTYSKPNVCRSNETQSLIVDYKAYMDYALVRHYDDRDHGSVANL